MLQRGNVLTWLAAHRRRGPLDPGWLEARHAAASGLLPSTVGAAGRAGRRQTVFRGARRYGAGAQPSGSGRHLLWRGACHCRQHCGVGAGQSAVCAQAAVAGQAVAGVLDHAGHFGAVPGVAGAAATRGLVVCIHFAQQHTALCHDCVASLAGIRPTIVSARMFSLECALRIHHAIRACVCRCLSQVPASCAPSCVALLCWRAAISPCSRLLAPAPLSSALLAHPVKLARRLLRQPVQMARQAAAWTFA